MHNADSKIKELKQLLLDQNNKLEDELCSITAELKSAKKTMQNASAEAEQSARVLVEKLEAQQSARALEAQKNKDRVRSAGGVGGV